MGEPTLVGPLASPPLAGGTEGGPLSSPLLAAGTEGGPLYLPPARGGDRAQPLSLRYSHSPLITFIRRSHLDSVERDVRYSYNAHKSGIETLICLLLAPIRHSVGSWPREHGGLPAKRRLPYDELGLDVVARRRR